MTSQDLLKRAAAQEALTRIESGMRVGLGTGSTMRHFVELLAEALAEGRLSDIVGVPTSLQTETQARGSGIPLAELHELAPLDLAVDGADEVDPRLDLIKGLGGALVREKMVAQAADRFVIVADRSKEVETLGTRSPLPVEVVRFGWMTHLPTIAALGAEGLLRRDSEGAPMLTDNGNVIIDCRFSEGIDDPFEVQERLRARSGVVDTGLFLGLAHEAILADEDGLTIQVRGDES
jgi:ribose 5-phosphate isomerase A